MLLNSGKQTSKIGRFAPVIFESICVYDVPNKQNHHRTYTVYIIKENFHGNLDFAFQTDKVFFSHMRNIEARMAFYLKIFESYQKLHSNKMKHCDIRPENILYKQIKPNEFIVVFDNFNQIVSYKKYCPDGNLAYMSPDEYKLDTMFPSDTQKKKTELFALALSILQIETNYIQTVAEENIKKVLESISEEEAQSGKF